MEPGFWGFLGFALIPRTLCICPNAHCLRIRWRNMDINAFTACAHVSVGLRIYLCVLCDVLALLQRQMFDGIHRFFLTWVFNSRTIFIQKQSNEDAVTFGSTFTATDGGHYLVKGAQKRWIQRLCVRPRRRPAAAQTSLWLSPPAAQEAKHTD